MAIKKGKQLYENCSDVERALIDAMSIRYSLDTTQSRERLNQLYADAMKKVHTDFPQSADAAALYADALMVQHPWDLYDKFYEPKPWTPELVRVLETLVKQFPDNPGASHYYIHAIEGSKHPEKGLEVANKLGSFMPGLAHLVHMPSHIYIRSGYYKKGVEVNDDAVKGYQNYLSKYPLVANSSFIYLMHNLHMKAACAAMDAQYNKALNYSIETRNSVDSSYLDAGGYWSMYSQYLYTTPLFTKVRFGKWKDIISSPAIPNKRVYAKTMAHFGRGLAYARLQQFDNAHLELQQMDDSLNSSQLHDHPAAFNAGVVAVEVAELILKGIIAEEQKKFPQAIAFLKEAVNKEDVMLYNEPKDWLLPVRHYLGNTLLKAKQFAEAENVFKADLKANPNNAWALTGLHKALVKQNKSKEALAIYQKLKTAIQSYMVGLLLEAMIIATLNSTALLILGVKYAILLGVIGALLNMLPYIGGIIAIALPVLIATVTKDGFSTQLGIIIAYAIIQFIDNNFIIPRIVSSKVQINALSSIVIVLLGGALWGVAGMFLSIPFIAILKIIFDRVEGLRPWGKLLGDEVPTKHKGQVWPLRRKKPSVAEKIVEEKK